MDASKITQLLQKQNTRYINRNQTVDASTLTWKNQIQSSKYIRGTPTCAGPVPPPDCNVPTNPACPDFVATTPGSGQLVANTLASFGQPQLVTNGVNSFGGAGRTTAIQSGSPQQFLSVYSGASGSASQVYSSEAILLQRAGKESCGVASTTTPAPENTYVVLPACYYVDTNGPTASVAPELSNPTVTGNSAITGTPNNLPVNNQSNPYLPPFDTYYRFKNPQCNQPIQDQNQKHFVKFCATCPPEASSTIPSGSHPYVIEPVTEPVSQPLQIYTDVECISNTSIPNTFNVFLSPGTPSGGVYTMVYTDSFIPSCLPSEEAPTINSLTGIITAPASFCPSGEYTVTYTVNNNSVSVIINLGAC